jgi:hypothetical protein
MIKTFREKYTDLINRYSKRIKWNFYYADLDLHPFFDRIHLMYSLKGDNLRQLKKKIKQWEKKQNVRR